MRKLVLYGLPNCDTTRKAIRWLKDKKINFYFHDYKKDGISSSLLTEWMNKLPWETIVNKRGTTWKGLPSALQSAVTDAETAIPILLEYNSIIKRPIIELNGNLIVGYDEAQYDRLLLKSPK